MRQFKTVAGGRLYEWLSLKSHRKWDRSYQVTKQQFVMMLGDTRYTEIGPDGHIVISRWDNYTKHVVDPALKELRQIAGFDVSVFYKRGASQGRRIERIVLTAMRKSKLTYALLDDDASTPLHTAHMNLKAIEEDTLRVSSLRIAKKTDLQRRGTDNGQKFTRNTHASGGHDVWSAAIERACEQDWLESEKRHAAGVPEEINRRPDPRKWRTMNAENLTAHRERVGPASSGAAVDASADAAAGGGARGLRLSTRTLRFRSGLTHGSARAPLDVA